MSGEQPSTVPTHDSSDSRKLSLPDVSDNPSITGHHGTSGTSTTGEQQEGDMNVLVIDQEGEEGEELEYPHRRFTTSEIIDMCYDAGLGGPDKGTVLHKLKKESPLGRKPRRRDSQAKDSGRRHKRRRPKREGASPERPGDSPEQSGSQTPTGPGHSPKSHRTVVSEPNWTRVDKEAAREAGVAESRQKYIERLTKLQETKFEIYRRSEEWQEKEDEDRRRRLRRAQSNFNKSPFRVQQSRDLEKSQRKLRKAKQKKELSRLKKLLREARKRNIDIEAHIAATVQEELIRQEQMAAVLEQRRQADEERLRHGGGMYDVSEESAAREVKKRKALVGDELTPL